jgi:hypothetical protein
MQALVSYPQKGIPLRLALAKAQVKARQGIASYRIVVPRGIVSSRLASSHSDRPANVSNHAPSQPHRRGTQRRSQTHLFAAVAGTGGTAAVGASATSSSAARHLGSSVCWGGWVVLGWVEKGVAGRGEYIRWVEGRRRRRRRGTEERGFITYTPHSHHANRYDTTPHTTHHQTSPAAPSSVSPRTPPPNRAVSTRRPRPNA